MRVTQVTYTRVKSDHLYGNHQAGVVAQVDESDDPAQVLACARELACQAVGGRPLPGVDGAPWSYVGEEADDAPELGDERDRDDEPAYEDSLLDDELIDEPGDPIVLGG